MIKLIFFGFLFFNIFMVSSNAQTMEGYLKSRIELFDGDYTLDKGAKINCTIKKQNKCCFEEEFGEVCIDKENISTQVIEKVDLSFSALKFPTEKLNDTCAKGVDATSEYRDGFHPRYALSVSNSNDIPVYINVSLYFNDGGDRNIVSSSFTKKIFTKANNSCEFIVITKKDINNIISEHNRIKAYLNIDFYTSSIRDTIKGRLVFNLLSNYNESDYSNNIKMIDVSIPVDSEENWPN